MEKMTVFRPILVILGPTASGKSALAMGVARKAGAEILSVDSMQVYKGMDIGTAKPTPAEQSQIRHHGIDVAVPTETFAVSQFVELADRTIADASRRNIPLIAAGGHHSITSRCLRVCLMVPARTKRPDHA
jgi:tRNA dimethylallyltransferase